MTAGARTLRGPGKPPRLSGLTTGTWGSVLGSGSLEVMESFGWGGDAEVQLRRCVPIWAPFRRPSDLYIEKQKFNGDLWLVINVLGGGLNHSRREMAQRLTA